VKRAYLLLYNSEIGDKEYVKRWLNSNPLVQTWRTDMPNCFYVITESDAQDLSDSFRQFTGPRGRFMFIEAGENRQGYMPPDTWYLLRNKSLKPSNK
jgi:hypothetical protein